MYSHRRNQTHGQIPREIEAGVPDNRSQKKQSARQKPTDPWVFGYGKPPWETAAEKPYGKPTSGICFVHECEGQNR